MLKAYALLYTLALCHGLVAQNLVQNGGFENHAPIECMNCYLREEKFKYTLPNWGNLSTGSPFLCDCKFKRTEDDVRSRLCDFNRLQPHGGCTMMQMGYMPRCTDHLFLTWGCSNYLVTTFTQPLQVGKVYEVSYWLYIEKSDDPDYARHIGMGLYRGAFRNQHGAMLEGDEFTLDTVVLEKWHRVSWLVQPTCELRELVIGVFRGEAGPPTQTDGYWNIFYVDDVAVLEAKAGAAGKEAQFFCKQKPLGNATEMPVVEGTALHFEVGKSLLSLADAVLLDSFAHRAKKHPQTTFTISGHTDSRGEGHEALSKERVDAVLGYLSQQHRMPAFRFVPIYAGDAMPLAENAQEVGRQQNRRVEIKQSSYPLPNVMYRHLLLLTQKSKEDEVKKNLLAWLNATTEPSKLLALFDPRLAVFHQKKWWPMVTERVRDAYKKTKNPPLAYLLDSLWAEDQRHRTLQYHIENLPTYLEDLDQDSPLWKVDFGEMTAATALEDSSRFVILKKIIEENGWPTIEEVGERPAKAAFLISAHTNDTAALAIFLPKLKTRCTEGEAEWIWYATLYDRWLVIQDKPQRYGTQFKAQSSDSERPELLPLENKEKLNEWRAEIGLEIMNEK